MSFLSSLLSYCHIWVIPGVFLPLPQAGTFSHTGAAGLSLNLEHSAVWVYETYTNLTSPKGIWLRIENH